MRHIVTAASTSAVRDSVLTFWKNSPRNLASRTNLSELKMGAGVR